MTWCIRGTVVLALGVLVPACGAAGAGGADDARSATAEWTQAELRKLDPELRTRVQGGANERIPVKVFFYELPTDAELADLFLNRLGEQAIGELEPDALHRLASRGDVERIEPLRDVGYDLP